MKDKFSILEKFGLTPYEIKLYVTLLENGPMTATAAASAASVPQPRVYDTFRNLMDKGFVEMSLEKKRIYKAADPELIINKKISEISESGELAKKELKRLAEIGTPERIPSLWVIRKGGIFLEHLRKIISTSETELVLAIRRDTLVEIAPQLSDAIERGMSVALSLINRGDELEAQERELLSRVFLKNGIEGSIEMCLSDQNKGIVRIPRRSSRPEYCLLVEEDEITHILSYYFYHSIWQPEMHIGIPEGRKKFSFTTIWFACETSNLLMEKGSLLDVEIEGFRDGEPVVVKGKVDHVEMEFGVRNTIFVEHDGHMTTIGGRNMIFEDVMMKRGTIRISGRKGPGT